MPGDVGSRRGAAFERVVEAVILRPITEDL